MNLKVAGGDLQVAPTLRQPGCNLQRGARVMSGDRVERAEQQVIVGDSEHGENVLNRDRTAGVGDELLECAERVAE